MAKKNRSQKNFQGLIIFKHKDKPKKEIYDRYSVEKTHKAEKFQIINQFSTQGIHYRYSILLNNKNSVPIKDIDIQITFPEFFKYTEFYPKTLNISPQIEGEKEKINLNIKRLESNSSEQIYLHFTPSPQLATGEFKTSINYINNKKKRIKINLNSITIESDDIAIVPKIISHSRIREFSKIPGMKRAVISLGIGTKRKLNFKKIYDIFE
ncbi:MAG: hypothetical protein ACW972_10910, partial [Promethearchaeota archaeon]